MSRGKGEAREKKAGKGKSVWKEHVWVEKVKQERKIRSVKIRTKKKDYSKNSKIISWWGSGCIKLTCLS